MSRHAAPLGLFALLAVLLGVGLTLDPREVPSPLIGKPAPAFALPELRDPGRTFARADLLGEVTLLNVWATWCVGCREEHPLLVHIAREGGVPIYGLNHKDDRAKAVAWLDRLGDPYRVSGFDADGAIGIEYGVYGLPETFVIDRAGVIAYKHIGPITPRDWEHTIRPLVARLRGDS